MVAGQAGKKYNMKDAGITLMERFVATNKQPHKGFHQSMNILFIYILEHYGKEKLIEYLSNYALSYHKPLHDKLATGDLRAMYEYLKTIYEKEEWPVSIEFDKEMDEIRFKQSACPAMTQIKSMDGQPCAFYYETYNTVYKTICKGTPFNYYLVSFDIETGACKQVFRKIQTIKQ